MIKFIAKEECILKILPQHLSSEKQQQLSFFVMSFFIVVTLSLVLNIHQMKLKHGKLLEDACMYMILLLIKQHCMKLKKL